MQIIYQIQKIHLLSVRRLKEGITQIEPIYEKPPPHSTKSRNTNFSWLSFLSYPLFYSYVTSNQTERVNDWTINECKRKITWAKEYMRHVLRDLGADHEWITSTSTSISSFCTTAISWWFDITDHVDFWERNAVPNFQGAAPAGTVPPTPAPWFYAQFNDCGLENWNRKFSVQRKKKSTGRLIICLPFIFNF